MAVAGRTSVEQLIAAAGDRLTPTERRLADLVVADPSTVAFGTVAEVAAAVDTSGPTVVRFAAKLGLDGYSALQDQIRGELRVRLARPGERLAADRAGAGGRANAIGEDLRRVLGALDTSRVTGVARRVAGARAVWIVSGEASGAAGHVLHAGCALLRERVTLVADGGPPLVAALTDATSSDVAIVIDFPRHRRDVVAAAASLAESGVDVVAITDGPMSPLAAVATSWFGLPVTAVGPFDSAVASVALAELLLAGVADALRDEVSARLARLEGHWDRLDVHHED